MNPHGKVALVTGAGSGLGKATCKVLSELGINILAVDMSSENLATLHAELGSGVLGHVADVSDEMAARGAVQSAVARFGGLHVAVNCAGVADSGGIL